MATYSITPIEFRDANTFKEIQEWEVAPGAPLSLYFILTIEDVFGKRRYVPSNGTNVKVTFYRSRSPQVGSSGQSFVKTAASAAPQDDRSMFRIDLSAQETSQIISGGVKLSVGIANMETSYNVPYLVKRVVSGPGF